MSKFASKLSDQELIEELLERGYSVLPRDGSSLIHTDHFEDHYSASQFEDVKWSRYIENRLVSQLANQLKKSQEDFVTLSSEPEEQSGRPGTMYRASMRVLVRQDRLGTTCNRGNMGVSPMQQSYVIGSARRTVEARCTRETSRVFSMPIISTDVNDALVHRPEIAEPLGYDLDSQSVSRDDAKAG